MVFILLLGYWIGSFGDKHFGFEKPYLGVGLAILLLVGLFYKLYRDMMHNNL